MQQLPIYLLLFFAIVACKATHTTQSPSYPQGVAKVAENQVSKINLLPVIPFFSWRYYDLMQQKYYFFPTNVEGTATFASVTVRHFKETLNETTRVRQYLDSVRLDSAQIVASSDFFEHLQPDDVVARCYDPHHEFVYRDEAGKTLGILEICFLCEQMRYLSPQRAGRYPLDKAAAEQLKKMVLAYGILVGEGE